MAGRAAGLEPEGAPAAAVRLVRGETRYDCWRVYPDGFRAVARYAGLETVECWTQWQDVPQYDEESNKWHDSVLVARKPAT